MMGPAQGQPLANPPSTPDKVAASAPIPLADINSESETVLAFTRDLPADLSADRSTVTVMQRLPRVTREIDDRLRENRKIVAQLPSIDVLAGLEGEWNRMRYELAGFNQDLTGRVNELERYLAQLDELVKTWDQTLAASKDDSAPPELVNRIESVIAEIRQAHEAADKQRALALTIQSRVGVQDSRVAEALTSVDTGAQKCLEPHLPARQPADLECSCGLAARLPERKPEFLFPTIYRAKRLCGTAVDALRARDRHIVSIDRDASLDAPAPARACPLRKPTCRAPQRFLKCRLRRRCFCRSLPVAGFFHRRRACFGPCSECLSSYRAWPFCAGSSGRISM